MSCRPPSAALGRRRAHAAVARLRRQGAHTIIAHADADDGAAHRFLVSLGFEGHMIRFDLYARPASNRRDCSV